MYSEYSEHLQTFRKFHNHIHTIFNFKNFVKPDEPYFNTGVYDELDTVAQTIHDSKYHLECICKRLSNIIDPKKGGCKFDKNDKIGYFLFCTKNRSKTLFNRFKNIPDHCINVRDDNDEIIHKLACDSFTFSTKDGSNVFVETPEIKQLTKQLAVSSVKIKELNEQYWAQIMNDI